MCSRMSLAPVSLARSQAVSHTRTVAGERSRGREVERNEDRFHDNGSILPSGSSGCADLARVRAGLVPEPRPGDIPVDSETPLQLICACTAVKGHSQTVRRLTLHGPTIPFSEIG